MSQSQRDKGYYIGFLGSIAIALAFLMLMYALTFPIESKDSFVYMALLGIVGISMGFIMVGFRLQPFDFKHFTQTLMWSGISFCLIYIVNRMVPVRIDIASPYGETMFSVLAGVVGPTVIGPVVSPFWSPPPEQAETIDNTTIKASPPQINLNHLFFIGDPSFCKNIEILRKPR